MSAFTVSAGVAVGIGVTVGIAVAVDKGVTVGMGVFVGECVPVLVGLRVETTLTCPPLFTEWVLAVGIGRMNNSTVPAIEPQTAHAIN